MTGRRALRIAARCVVGLTSAAVLGAVAFGWLTYRSAVDDLVTDDVIVADPDVPADLPEQPPRTDQTILLVGMDSRTDAQGNPLPQDVLDALRAGEASGVQNTDTMIVLHVPADPDKRAFAISLPRDSYVELAGGYGKHKLNSAYARAKNETGSVTEGRKNLIATVTALTGLRIDHYAEINLLGFAELTNAVGGVPVCLIESVDDKYSGANFPAGAQTLQGVDALKFVRQRHGLTNGDLDRVRRQQAFLAGLANKAFSAGTLTDPGAITDLVGALTKSVVLDQGWDLIAFAQQIASLGGENLEFHTIPTGRINLSTPYDGSAVEVDPGEVQAFVQSLLAPPVSPPDGPPVGTPPPDEKVVLEDRASPGGTRPMANFQQQSEEPTITAGGIPCVN
jgi:LCP family protein required for cell wall assembly